MGLCDIGDTAGSLDGPNGKNQYADTQKTRQAETDDCDVLGLVARVRSTDGCHRRIPSLIHTARGEWSDKEKQKIVLVEGCRLRCLRVHRAEVTPLLLLARTYVPVSSVD